MNEIKQLEKYINSLTSVDIFTTNHGLGKVWANRSQLLFFVEQIKQSLARDVEDQREKTDKVVAYDQLDHKFRLVCGKGVEQTLQHLCMVGFGDGSKVNHELVEVPKFPQHIVEYLDWCKKNNKPISEVIGSARHYKRDYAFWTEEESRNIAVAYCTGKYTVAKEPLYYVKFPNVETNGYDSWLIKMDDGAFELADNNDFESMQFTEAEIKAIDERYWLFKVPVEEEAE